MNDPTTRRQAAALIRRLLDHPGLDAEGEQAIRLRLEGAAAALEVSARADRPDTRTP